MSNPHQDLGSSRFSSSVRRSLGRVVIILAVAFGLWIADRQGWLKQEQPSKARPSSSDSVPVPASEPASTSAASASAPEARNPDRRSSANRRPSIGPAVESSTERDADRPWLIVPKQTIRDESGAVVFEGEVDLRATLDRIERGEKAKHRNDGAVFQNREGRLPRHPAGYYHEYVHPTPNLSGPGPQRVILGANREIYYTPNHYRSFQRLSPPH